MLAVVFSFEKFHQYTFGRYTKVISDHKPLEMIVKKALVKAPKRLQGMLLRLQKYDYDIVHQAGKTMYLADTLSRAFINNTPQDSHDFEEVNVVTFLPIREERLEQIRKETEQDESLQILKRTILNGWPETRDFLPEQVTPYFGYRDELAVQNGLIFRGGQVVIPQKLRQDMKVKIHSSHLGTDGCLRRARESLFWPNMSSEIKHYIATCDICRTYENSQQKETLMPHELPSRPWERVGTDLFSWNKKDFLVTVDYLSNFWEIDLLPDTSSATVIKKLKNHFARYGSPTQVISDNGPQYTSDAFADFAKAWDFEHLCSSPGNSQANGKAESAVKTAKRILTKTNKAGTDPYIALLDHRNTPTQGLKSSPAQRLMNRRTRTLLPTSAELLKPKIVDEAGNMQRRTDKQAAQFNKSAKDLKPLDEGDVVRMKPLVQGQKTWTKAIVSRRLDERSYMVETPHAVYRRNRVHLKKTSELPPAPKQDSVASASNKQLATASYKQQAATGNKQQTTTDNKQQASTPNQHQQAPETKTQDKISKPVQKKASSTTEPATEQTLTTKTTKSGRQIKSPSYLADYVK